MAQFRAVSRGAIEPASGSETEPEQTGRRAPRRLVALGVIVYCLAAWAGIFGLVKLGVALSHPTGAHYAGAPAERD